MVRRTAKRRSREAARRNPRFETVVDRAKSVGGEGGGGSM